MKWAVAASAVLVLAIAGCGSPAGSSGGAAARAPRDSPTATPSAPTVPQRSPARASLAVRQPLASTLPVAGETADATQIITVVASSLRSTTATLQAWDRVPGAAGAAGWVRRGPAVTAYLGDQGLTTRPTENLSATPAGSFALTQAFGSAENPGTRLPYFRTDSSDWWVTDATSRHYNTHYRCSASCPFETGLGENLYRAGFLYTYAVVIDYNRHPVTPGAGSAFFLHVTEYKPTTGCVSIPRTSLVSIMRWLSPSPHPRIIIGVG